MSTHCQFLQKVFSIVYNDHQRSNSAELIAPTVTYRPYIPMKFLHDLLITS